MTSRLLLTAALALWSVSILTFADDQSALCDQLAASSVDAARPAGIAGVPYGDIVVADAEPACRAAWEAGGEPRMAYQLARTLAQAGRTEDALAMYRAAADGGYVEAKVGVGQSLMDIAYGEAVALNEEAAAAGSFNALFNLGVFARDYDEDGEKALSLFGQAAAQGDVEAAYNIAVIYDEGLLVIRDVDAAKRHYEEAVEGGFGWAKINLGYLLLEGDVSPEDRAKSLTLFRSATEVDGDVNAGLQLGIMLQDGTPAEQVESEGLVLAALRARDLELARFLQQDDTGLSQKNLAAILAELSAGSIAEALAKLPDYYATQR